VCSQSCSFGTPLSPFSWLSLQPEKTDCAEFTSGKYSKVWAQMKKAGMCQARIGIVRYRSWLNAAGTPLGVQKDLLRHSHINTTLSYGAGMADVMRQFNSQVVKQSIFSPSAAREIRFT
jgi:hypothetical protein